MRIRLRSIALATGFLACIACGPVAAQSCPTGTNYVGTWVEHTSDTDITHVQCQETATRPALPMSRDAPIAPGQPIYTPGESAECKVAEKQLAEWQRASRLALLASDAYSSVTDMHAISGFTRVSDDTNKLHAMFPSLAVERVRALMASKTNDYHAAIYQDDQTQKYYVVFRGTQSWTDWKQGNAAQWSTLGSPYYDSAIQLAQIVKGSVGAANFETVGHSLGGGLAIAAALSAGVGATTYNPAGVRAATVASPRATDANGITNYIVDGEPLTFLQRNQNGTSNTGLPSSNPRQFMPPAVGHNIIMPADWAGAPGHDLRGLYNLHRMETGVLPALSEETANSSRAVSQNCGSAGGEP